MARCSICDVKIDDDLLYCENCEGNKEAIDAINAFTKELGGSDFLPYYNPPRSASSVRQTASAKPAVGIVVDVAQGDKSYGKFVKDRLMALASRSGKFTEAMGFEAFLNKELPKEMAQRDAQMKRGGTYYEPVARLAKRFGIPYACLVMVETDNDYGRISAAIGDANDETSLQVMNVESQGSKISNESLDKFFDTVITYLSR